MLHAFRVLHAPLERLANGTEVVGVMPRRLLDRLLQRLRVLPEFAIKAVQSLLLVLEVVCERRNIQGREGGG
eukprot:NODE_15677_length_1037_cov_1.491209.p4 GENE.NODE_15677_length_1037_cov_1.491209~~NODE_15677_length_1037_cov_1.491209.p4  ORF type:complete len:72 (+),score=9.33 NODE_15677_length_1037_cov_1.491209:495-710(+)